MFYKDSARIINYKIKYDKSIQIYIKTLSLHYTYILYQQANKS